MEADDFALMESVQKDDPGAFERLVERYQRRLYRLAFGYLHNHEDALDAVQEAMVKIYLARHTYRPSAHPFTWAARVLVNQCIDQIRRRRARPERPLEGVQDERSGWSLAEAARAQQEDPLARQERREVGRLLNEAIFALPLKQREIFVLRHFGEMQLEEIAATRGCAVGTVKSSLHRAAAAIRGYLMRVDPAFGSGEGKTS